MSEPAPGSSLLSGKFSENGGDIQGYNGEGTYTLAQFRYVGGFKEGLFHGKGVCHIKTGGRIEGEFENGKLVKGGFIYDDGLEHKRVEESSWSYCSKEDPRFYIEHKEGLPNTQEGIKYDTSRGNEFTPIPLGCYDCVDGYYDPKKLAVCSFEDGDPFRMPDKAEKEWIHAHCRKIQ